MRLIMLRRVGEQGAIVWLNPDHIIALEPLGDSTLVHTRDGRSWDVLEDVGVITSRAQSAMVI